MPVDLSNTLVIGISSRALFDLEAENEIFRKKGLEEYCKYQLQREDDILPPGTGFPLVKAILHLNTLPAMLSKITTARYSAPEGSCITN
jgi:5'-nucleotidase